MNKISKLSAALLSVICCLALVLPCAAGGEDLLGAYGMDLDLFLTYLDVNGEEMSIYPVPAGADGDTVLLWGFLPDPTVEEVTLHVSDINGLYLFTPDEGTDLQVIDAGLDQSGAPLCEITARSEDGETILIRLYLSLSAPEPSPGISGESGPDSQEEPTKKAVQITVHFVDEQGNSVAPDRAEMVWTGQMDAVYADTLDGYIRLGDPAQTVYLPLGTTQAEDVTFVYRPDGQYAGQDPAGTEWDSPDAEADGPSDTDLPDEGEEETDTGLQTEDPDGGSAFPDGARDEGADPSLPAGGQEADGGTAQVLPVDFQETDLPGGPTPGPAPVVKLIQVVYSYENDLYGYSSTRLEPISEGETLLFAEEPKSGYLLEGEDSQLVTVYPDGTAEPETVVFSYVRAADRTEQPVFSTTIPVYYQSEDGTNVATPTLETVVSGSQIIYANPVDLRDGYDLVTGPQEVVCAEDGTLTPGQLVFIYRFSGEEAIAPQDGKNDFALQPYSGYARALRTVNLRSYPDQADSGNIIATISVDDLIVLYQITNYKNATWYYVSVNGRMGYVSASVVRELTESETAVLEKNAGSDEETPEGNDLPGLIERWGKTTTKVRFRTAPDGKTQKELKKNTEIFVLSSEEKDGVLWYSALSGGKTGWVMAQYVELFTASQSALKQSQVKTPAPTHTPQMTRVPTSTPTMYVPTPSPDPVEESKTSAPSPTPVPYTGYGLSSVRAAVRSSLSLNDESVREMIAVDTLVSIQGQAYVEGVCWDSVRVLSSGVTGFMQDSQLRRISDTEADYYIASLTTPTPAPVILFTPEPFAGMARTLGGDVPLRTDMSANAQIIALLPKDAVMQVYEQETSPGGITWCLAQFGQDLGYVRRDMIVQMNDWEIAGYIASLRTPTPEPAATATPAAVSQRATAYGIVNKDRVNLRQEPAVSSLSIYMMSRNEMAYILEAVPGSNGKTWYYVTVSNRIGYVSSEYLTVLTQNELDDFLNTEDFRSANNSENLIADSNSLYSYEDHLQQQWQSSSVSASFEPFNPYETPAPVIGTAASQPTPAPTATMPPAASPTIVAGFVTDDTGSGGDVSGSLSMGVILLAIGGAVILIGGIVIYVRGSRRKKRKRLALQRAQREQSLQRSRRTQNSPYGVSGETRRGAYRQETVQAPYDGYNYDDEGSSAPEPQDDSVSYRRPRPQQDPGETRRTGRVSRYRTERTDAPSYGDSEAYQGYRRRRTYEEADADAAVTDDETAMFRRPVRPSDAGARQERRDWEEDVPKEEKSPYERPESPQPPEEQTPPAAGRRRRTERYRSDS